MHKLRHIHSKVGTETAFRIPVSVEDAIAEAVEAYDALQNERDELAARVSELKNIIATGWQQLAFADAQGEKAEEIAMFVYRYLSSEVNKNSPAQSLLLHDVQVIRDVADKLTFHNIDDCSYYKGYDHAISDVRAAADALEGEGDG
jgi:hypothetical protein